MYIYNIINKHHICQTLPFQETDLEASPELTKRAK